MAGDESLENAYGSEPKATYLYIHTRNTRNLGSGKERVAV